MVVVEVAGVAISAVVAFLTYLAARAALRSATMSERAVELSRLDHLASYRPVIIPVPEGRELDRPEGALQLSNELLGGTKAITNLEWRPLISNMPERPSVYSIAIENAGTGVGIIDSVVPRHAMGDSQANTSEILSLVQVGARSIDLISPGEARRYSFLDTDPGTFGNAYRGLAFEVRYRSLDGSEHLSTWIQVSTGETTGRALISRTYLEFRVGPLAQKSIDGTRSIDAA